MGKRFALPIVIFILSLTAIGTVCVIPVNAQYGIGITINIDGSVSPSTAPIKQASSFYTLTSDFSGCVTVEANNTIIDGNGHTVKGFSLNSVSNVTLQNSTITNTAVGVSLVDVSNVTVISNTITKTGFGLGIYDLFYNHDTAAIKVSGGGSNLIKGNNFVSNYDGIRFSNTHHNLVIENNITDTSCPGFITAALEFSNASNNTFYHNNFINNRYQRLDSGYPSVGVISVNIWDNGNLSGGNYWSDYLIGNPHVAEIDHLGIGNISYYVIPANYYSQIGTSGETFDYWKKANDADANNTDHYPLMQPFNSSFLIKYEQEVTSPAISLVSPVNQTYSNSSISLIFTIDKTANWIGYSLDGQQNLTLTGNITLTGLSNSLHNITVYSNDTYGNMGASQSVNFTITKQESFSVITVVEVSGVIVAIAVAGLLVYFKKHKRLTS